VPYSDNKGLPQAEHELSEGNAIIKGEEIYNLFKEEQPCFMLKQKRNCHYIIIL